MGPVLGAAVALGTVSVLARRAYADGADPLPLLGARVLTAAVVLTAVALVVRPPVARSGLVRSGLAGAVFAAAGLGEFEALARASAPTVVVLVFVAPGWIALAERVVHRRRLGVARTVPLAAVAGGLALLVAAPAAAQPGAAAVALALGASVMSAAFFVLLGTAGGAMTAPATACAVAWGASALVVPLDVGGVAHTLTSPRTEGYGLAIGALTAVGLALLATGVPLSSAFVASAVICVEPVVAGVLSWIVLDELLTLAQLAGATVVVAAVAALAAVSSRVPPSRDATGRTTPPLRGSRPPPRPARSAPRLRSGGRWRGRPG